jgi:ubiquinone/menaquinone biosynthesis C-methylase UbiE
MTEIIRNESSWSDPLSMNYHMKQWTDQKESTKAFANFFHSQLSVSRRILDIGSGGGAATFFLANEFLDTEFIGIDYSDELVDKAKETLKTFEVKNLMFDQGDWFNLNSKWGAVDGVISLQTLSWLPEMEQPMAQIFKVVNPNWIGLSSLFYEGDISCRIEVFEHVRGRKTFYNVYSIKELSRLAFEYGYEVQQFNRFEIGIDVPKSSNIDLMSTFTEKVQRGMAYERLQISGPLLMNWYFVLLTKI